MTREHVIEEALTWLGTPYHPHGRIKGVGVDCAQILCAVYEACGLVDPVDPGFYAMDHHLNRGEELYQGWLEKVGAVKVETPVPGDVGLWRFGRVFSHGGIVVDTDTIVHAYVKRGVIKSKTTEEPLSGRVVVWYSLFKG